ncbi:beta-lactamase superfamily hydrolase [Methanothermus fervidus DSM 2088]|uniref:Beta-lactamase superfamily hydrolase n=1 Tax=Methanothermus fervidus (strain ATCC 43054 / DSM 2088 / JCM 10308 / V24 S) TaxID=523846 RepID=E3GZ99_METFV|nr:MBL fold metallo-hydrolase [Methanothermus fervidus]ADP77631.1 beta-lactamase superfamily hydrolase [Methanothermus fervidus DSM 2088]
MGEVGFATITQKRMTGGFRIDHLDNKNFHIDPGPGAFIRTYQFGLNPINLDVVLVSHAHTDHYSDVEVMIEAMTKGMTRRRGTIVGSRSVIEGYNDFGPCISKYHLTKSDVVVMEPGDTTKIGNVKIKATPTQHGDPTGIGFQFKTKDIVISYTSDTAYFEDLGKYHKGADILIANVIRPNGERIRGHMCTDDLKKLLNIVRPKLTIMTHFGMKMINNNPAKEARDLCKETSLRVIPASDGMKIDLSNIAQRTLNDFFMPR